MCKKEISAHVLYKGLFYSKGSALYVPLSTALDAELSAMIFLNAHSKSLRQSAGRTRSLRRRRNRTAKQPWSLVARTHKALMSKTHNSESFQNHSWIFKYVFLYSFLPPRSSKCLPRLFGKMPHQYSDMSKKILLVLFYPFLPLILSENKESQLDTLMNVSPFVGSPQTRPARRAIWLNSIVLTCHFFEVYWPLLVYGIMFKNEMLVSSCLLLYVYKPLFPKLLCAGATSSKVCSSWSSDCCKGRCTSGGTSGGTRWKSSTSSWSRGTSISNKGLATPTTTKGSCSPSSCHSEGTTTTKSAGDCWWVSEVQLGQFNSWQPGRTQPPKKVRVRSSAPAESGSPVRTQDLGNRLLKG